MFLVDYVLPAIIILGVLGGVYLLVRDNDVDVSDSNITDDKPAPPNPKPSPNPPVQKETKGSKPKSQSQKSKTQTDDISNMSKSQLIKLAQKRGIKVNSRMRKDHIIRKLK